MTSISIRKQLIYEKLKAKVVAAGKLDCRKHHAEQSKVIKIDSVYM